MNLDLYIGRYLEELNGWYRLLPSKGDA